MADKYFKRKADGLILKWFGDSHVPNCFKGEVIEKGDSPKEVGVYYDRWSMEDFEPCEAPKATQPEQSPTKDVELRLECLKLAVNAPTSFDNAVKMAQGYYDWVTKEDKAV